MEFRIADTFTSSLNRLTGDEQKAVKTSAFDLQMNPAHPGLHFHKLESAKDKNFWSVRVSRDIRLIVHKTDTSLLLCYVDHHEDAYAWAERRRLERHPKTGAAQLVEVRERIREIAVPRYVDALVTSELASPVHNAPARPLFEEVPVDHLLGYGVPPEWIVDVQAATEDSLLELAEHLPSEAAEALLELATGKTPVMPVHAAAGADPFEHPDAQRRFRVMTDKVELERALEFPWEKWTVFLHPAQRHMVEREFFGPARVSGSAGTGKTIVALHRAVSLGRADREARVLLTTFSDMLANALRVKLRRLIGNEPRLGERIEVHSLWSVALRLYETNLGPPKLASEARVREQIAAAAVGIDGLRFTPAFLWSEWSNAVDAWQLGTWEEYRDVKRLGRRTRLSEKQRETLWGVFVEVRSALEREELLTESGVFARLTEHFAGTTRRPFGYVVVDEAQDIGVAELRFLAVLGSARPDALFFAGDLGQRIFQQPFSWKALGVDIRGRSSTLRINYRTSHQIRAQADLLLGPVVTDVDGNAENRNETVSVFNGPPPRIDVLPDEQAEATTVGAWIAACTKDGILPQEIGVFVRSEAQIERALAAVAVAGVSANVLDGRVETANGHVSVSTMHIAKGLEFRAVAVMACDDEVTPLQERIEAVGDDADLKEIYDTERHLLYVACTRARDRLLVTAVEPASEFLSDLSLAPPRQG